MIGRHQRSRLLYVLTQNFAQPRLQEMGCCVIAHGGQADVGVDHSINFLSQTDRLFRDYAGFILDRVCIIDPFRGTRWTPNVTFERIPYVSPREKQLLRRFARGKTDEQIAGELGSTAGDIAGQRQRIAEKFRIQTDEQLRAVAKQIANWPRPGKQ